MKVTFECEKCGKRWEKTMIYGVAAVSTEHICTPPDPTYGPLTVEMVAEALWECIRSGETPWPDVHPSSQEELRNEARFVLRLLHDCVESDRRGTVIGPDPREWLLDLARQ